VVRQETKRTGALAEISHQFHGEQSKLDSHPASAKQELLESNGNQGRNFGQRAQDKSRIYGQKANHGNQGSDLKTKLASVMFPLPSKNARFRTQQPWSEDRKQFTPLQPRISRQAGTTSESFRHRNSTRIKRCKIRFLLLEN
jgi:hypothetical protein